MKNKIIIAVIIVITTGCSTVQLPNNVSVSNKFIDIIDFSYQSDQPKSFAQLKLCLAENINNDQVTLKDSSNSFIGSATGNFYQITQDKTVQGGDIFKYAEKDTSTILAKGTADGDSVALGATKDLIKYELKAAVSNNNVTLKFSNITHALQNTGYITNDGFDRICVLSGCRPSQAYTAIAGIANKIKACLLAN